MFVNGMTILVAIALFWGGIVVGYIIKQPLDSREEGAAQPKSRASFKTPLKLYETDYTEYKNNLGRYQPVKVAK